MSRLLFSVFLVPVLIGLLLSGPALAAAGDAEGTAPRLGPKGRTWRIGYYEGGPYNHYQIVLKSVITGLAELGWIEPLPGQPPLTTDSRVMWDWIRANVRSRYIEFPADANWSAGWDAARREENRRAVLDRLARAGDLDAVIAMGTWAGQDLAVPGHNVPTFVFQSSDPVAAGIARSAGDSGLDHVFAHCDPERYKRQVRLFHDLFRFKKLGVAYEDTTTGRTYSGMADVEAVALERGFELVRCHTVTNSPDDRLTLESYLACHERLASEADAVYLTHSKALSPENMPRLLEPFLARSIPTFAQGGSLLVRHGALMSMSQAEFRTIGRFYAETISRVLRGAVPRLLPQVFEDPPSVAINLRTASNIGFRPPLELMAVAGEIFDAVAPPPSGP